ncbi:hypothetical protein FSP39_018076 [Pinctada imbricata]|uniref:Protein Jumonji n=1 Tax=Pinctada imbricata TaxID=66713 RepID=A0AA89BKY1_PINIB|nr:hypothetical protein FSP39_018076 [Pinctada imbricata]
MFPKRAKTEDFLTFLCLRGTPALPPHLDFFNFTRYDGTNYMSPHKSGRESSPSSTSTSLSNFNHDETGENSRTFSPVTKHITPTKKAARASAGTPETARGLQGVRPRLTKNSLKAQSPLAKSSSKIKSQGLRKRSPPKMTRSFSVPRTVPKLGMMRRSSETNPIRLSASSKLAIKRKSETSLTSAKLTGSKVKKSLTNEADGVSQKDRTNSDNTEENKNPRETYERKVTSVGMELRVRINLRKPRRRPASDFIAMRLPKRQAKENALKFYMESDDLENDENRSTSDEEITFPKKRKHDSGYDIDQCKIPFKKSRLKKTENRLKKSGTHGRKLLRCSKELQKLTGGNPDELAANLNDDSEGVSTRSASKNLNQKFGSRGSAAKVFANKRLQKIKEMKRKDLTKKSDSSDSEVKGKEKTQAAESNTQKVASEKEDVGLKEDNKTTKKEAPQPVKKGKGRPPGSLNKPKDGKEKKPSTLKQRGESRNLHREVSTSMTEVPTFFPTEEEFQQPIKYIQSISAMAEPFGMCKIIPPSSWKMDGKISEDVRFTTQKQYIHKMYKRFGPITEKLECIRRHLETQNTQEPMQVPTVGGVEIDLCKLSETIDKFGGMQHVIEKKKWMKVADAMNIPKLAQDRGTKLYDAYCKCLLSYNGLSTEEKEKLSALVNAERQKVRNEEQEEDCVVKGKSMSLGAFNRVARNTTSIWTKDEQMSTEQIEREYWNTVAERGSHVVVHGGHVDTKTQNCSMFPYKRENPYSKHPWNLNNLPNHRSSLLQYLHHVSGVTVPTLHVGMLYTSSCWSTDTHHLPYVQYLHNEADIIWYCIPSQEERKFQSVMKELVPTLVSSKIRWLKEDTAMVPPEVLLQRGVHVSRCVQQPHQFVVVFPKCYTATISCGYTLAESSHYATKEWLPLGVDVAKVRGYMLKHYEVLHSHHQLWLYTG